MNLKNMFEMQKKLDDHIMDEHLELKGQDNLDWKVLALLVEVGECANEWRGFKKWSNDQKPRTLKCIKEPKLDVINGIRTVVDEGEFTNPLLEEYVDGLHFILSIGLEENVLYQCIADNSIKQKTVMEQFVAVYHCAVNYRNIGYGRLLSHYLGLGEMLGFSQQEIEEAYMEKNAINHKRQEQGY